MDLIIPSAGRWTTQPTLKQLNRAGFRPYLVVQALEWERYAGEFNSRDVELVGLPKEITTIAPTRQWILERVGSSNTMIMLDDDLVFYKRRDDDRTKLRDITPTELHAAFWHMDAALIDYPHVGFAAREGANRNTDTHLENTRIMRVLGYSRSALQARGIRFDDVELMEDFHVALQLLERGLPNVVLNDYAHNQFGSNTSGGCSTFRSMDRHSSAARRLAELHPAFVSVVQKTTKGAWGGGTRDDVLIQWKKAFASGK